MGAGTYLTTALTAAQSQTGKQADSRRRDSIRFPFLGPSLLYYDDVVAPSGSSLSLWDQGSLNMERWEEKKGANMFLRQDYVVNMFSWDYSVTPNWSHWRLLFSRLADWTSWRGFTVWFFRSWATWRRIFRVSNTSKRMLWQVRCLSCLWEEREHFLGKKKHRVFSQKSSFHFRSSGRNSQLTCSHSVISKSWGTLKTSLSRSIFLLLFVRDLFVC